MQLQMAVELIAIGKLHTAQVFLRAILGSEASETTKQEATSLLESLPTKINKAIAKNLKAEAAPAEEDVNAKNVVPVTVRVPSMQSPPTKTFQVEPQSCEYNLQQLSKDFAHASLTGWGRAASFPAVVDPSYYYTEGHKSLSGRGSDLDETTVAAAKFLANVITEYDVKTLVDVPCGDANWQFREYPQDAIDAYVGLDIMPELIALNNARFAHHSNKHFIKWDMAACALPHIRFNATGKLLPPDLVHVRDAIQHLPLQQGVATLMNVVSSGARMFIATTFPSQRGGLNMHIPNGFFYKPDLLAAPFSLPSPIECAASAPGHDGAKGDDQTCLWLFSNATRQRLHKELSKTLGMMGTPRPGALYKS